MAITATATDPSPYETGAHYEGEDAVTHKRVVNNLYDAFASGGGPNDSAFLAAISGMTQAQYDENRNHLTTARQAVNNPTVTP